MRRALASLAAACWLPAAHAASVEIHPAGPTIPENLLRMELRFDRPQPLPFDIRRLTLLDARGMEMPNALLDLALPSADGRRITVLMDPGRVKSGVGPNVDAGRALRVGEAVSLRVDGAAVGEPAVVKAWRVTTALSHPLDPASWHVQPPRAGSRDALVVDLRDAISSAGEALMAVVGPDGQRVAGATALTGDDAVWRFTPSRPWRAGDHAVVTHPHLEDPAGNRGCVAFEQMQGSAVACETGATLRFAPRSPR